MLTKYGMKNESTTQENNAQSKSLKLDKLLESHKGTGTIKGLMGIPTRFKRKGIYSFTLKWFCLYVFFASILITAVLIDRVIDAALFYGNLYFSTNLDEVIRYYWLNMSYNFEICANIHDNGADFFYTGTRKYEG